MDILALEISGQITVLSTTTADVNRDGVVDVQDLLAVILEWS